MGHKNPLYMTRLYLTKRNKHLEGELDLSLQVVLQLKKTHRK